MPKTTENVSRKLEMCAVQHVAGSNEPKRDVTQPQQPDECNRFDRTTPGRRQHMLRAAWRIAAAFVCYRAVPAPNSWSAWPKAAARPSLCTAERWRRDGCYGTGHGWLCAMGCVVGGMGTGRVGVGLCREVMRLGEGGHL